MDAVATMDYAKPATHDTITADETAPNSPPELSYSKSSKSSETSEEESLSEEEAPADKLAHFQDISIEDGGGPPHTIDDRNLKPESRPTLKRPPPRGSTTNVMHKRMGSPPRGARENRPPALRTDMHGPLRDQSLNLPQGRGMRRGFGSPSSPSHPMTNARKSASRSPSPNKPNAQNGANGSPQMLSASTPPLSAEARSPTSATGRRQSWQARQKKSVKELEAECDKEDDDEVPMDAVLENIPISPMPGQDKPTRLSPRPSPRPSRSPTPSPNRPAAHSGLHSAKVPKHAKRPHAPVMLPNGQHAPRSPKHRRPHLPHSASSSYIPDRLNKIQRSQSWTEDLNNEARELTQALEEYAERLSSEVPGSGHHSNANSPPRPDMASKRAKTAVDLPPVQKSNVNDDPLPISKEKEAFLTRTRPGWLPPKCQKEEKKHLKEWEQMMTRSAENEKKRLSREKDALESQEQAKDNVARLWEQHVLPHWDDMIQEPRTRELWWRGLPPASRGTIWQKAIGNDLELTPTTFTAALKRATVLATTLSALSPDDRATQKETPWLDAIARDATALAPADSPLHTPLTQVLQAYAFYRSDVGYIYGTHHIAHTLLTTLTPTPDPATAFTALANVLNRSLPLAFLVHDLHAMHRAHALVLATLRHKAPALHATLTSPETGLRPDEYLDPLFRSLFTRMLPAAHAERVWDVFVFEGDKALIRAGVAVLLRVEGMLVGKGKAEVLGLLGWGREEVLGHEVLGEVEEFMTGLRGAGKVDVRSAEVRKDSVA